MRVMVIVKANKDSEAGVLPDEKMLTAMGRYNEKLVNAGVFLNIVCPFTIVPEAAQDRPPPAQEQTGRMFVPGGLTGPVSTRGEGAICCLTTFLVLCIGSPSAP